MFVLYYTTEHVDPFVGIKTPRNRIVKVGTQIECEQLRNKLYGRSVTIKMVDDNMNQIINNVYEKGNTFEWSMD